MRVEFEPTAQAPGRPSTVRLSVDEVAHTIDVLEAIDDNDGDARMQLAAVRDLRRPLTKRALG